MGFGERRAREDHFRGYEEGYADGYAAGFKAGGLEKLRNLAPVGGRLSRVADIDFGPDPRNPRAKKKRRKTAYQSAYSAAYKRLKKKHPRMAFGSLSKKAHAAARKKVK